MSPLTVEAPTDAQLVAIANMCSERGIERPSAVYSKAEASEIITAIQVGQYDPSRYVPTHLQVHEEPWADFDYDDEIPF